MNGKKRIAVIGSGYVGFVTAISLAFKGHKVVCMDKREEVVKKISAGIAPFYEKGAVEMLNKALLAGNISATSNIEEGLMGSDVIFITVGTPPRNCGGMDLSQVKEASEDIGRFIKDNDGYRVVAVKSTVIPTTTDNVVKGIIEKYSMKRCGNDFGLCMNPEFLREGCAVEDFMNPDRIVIGAYDLKSLDFLKEIYSSFDSTVVETSITTAEMIKYASNVLFATLISFSNEMSCITESIGGVDVKDVLGAVCLDRRLNPPLNGRKKLLNPGLLNYLEAGCGFGGSCLPKDTKSLASFAKRLNVETPIINSVISVNEGQPKKLMELLKSVYADMSGLKMAVLGLSFKPFTSDFRVSPAISLVNSLCECNADVVVYDPVVGHEFDEVIDSGAVRHAASWEDAVEGAWGAIVVTAWDEFKGITGEGLKKLMKNPVLIDGRRMFEREKFKDITYLGIGYRGAEHSTKLSTRSGLERVDHERERT